MTAAITQGDSVDAAIKLATKFYTDRRADMDAGAVVANTHRYDAHHEASALQHCYNIIADQGQDAFQTEYQNDPPESTGPQESGIYPDLVASRLSGLERGIVPPNYPLLTGAIDIGKTAMHWCVTAWCKAGTGSVIDYGVQDVWPKDRDNERAVEVAILQALYGLREQLLAANYCYPGGEIVPMQCVLVDSGNWDRPVYEFVRATGQKIFRASKGIGDGAGGQRSAFRLPDKQTADKRVGDHCFLAQQEAQGVWLVGMDANYWKAWLHERFMTPDGSPQGCLTLFGNDKRQHFAFAHHICSEIEVEEFVDGKGLKRYWKKVNRNNHWLDTTYAACVAASLHGMKLLNVSADVQRKRLSQPAKPSSRMPFLSRPGGWVRGMR
jgi:phage terminase large subunit GpA-like protein